MDLGIAGRRAVVAASSRGLGLACADALAAEGVHLVINGRDAERLATVAADLADRHGVEVVPVAADLDTAEGREAVVAAGPEPDILVTNNAGPAPASFTGTDADTWAAALTANMLGPIHLIQLVVDGMRARRFGRIVNITSAMVTTPHPYMVPSIGARAGLTGAVKALSKEVAADGVTVNNLLPERIDTDRQRYMADLAVQTRGITLDEARAEQAASIAARRLGRPEEVGATCAFLCSVPAAFLSGQNIHLDGGSYGGLV